MDVVQGVTLGLAVLAGVVAVFSMRSDRTKDITAAALSLVDPLTARVDALRAEVAGALNEVARLERCLVKNGIDIGGCE